jgi:glutathione S-transferase
MPDLTLLVLPTAWGLRNASSFVLKAEALLALRDLAYDTEVALPSKGPKGKLPALIDRIPQGGGRIIGDSSLIQRHLEEAHDASFDDGLDPSQLADAEAYRRMAEEWLYFAALHVRWIQQPMVTREALFASVPAVVRPLVFAGLRRNVRRTLYGQGIGRHATAEVNAFGTRALHALAERIGTGPFFFGERLRSVDAALYPQVLNITDAPYESDLRDAALARPELRAYALRCQAAIFRDA